MTVGSNVHVSKQFDVKEIKSYFLEQICHA